MRKSLFFLVLFISVEGLAQPGETIIKPPSGQKTINADSILDRIEKMKKVNDSLLMTMPAPDSNTINISGLLELQKIQKDRRAKEKRVAMIRIGIGLAFLIVLIIGLRRKSTKKKGEQTQNT